MNWLTDKHRHIAYGVPPKNGCNSIRKILNGHMEAVRIESRHMKNFKYIVFIVRHPVDRFLSLWRSKCRDCEGDLAVDGMSQEELFTYIKTAIPDDHWHHQALLIRPYQDRAEVVRMENMPAWWARIIGTDYPHEHRTAPDDSISAELRAKVCDHYRHDLELYNAAS